eukprot:gene2258-4385_t
MFYLAIILSFAVGCIITALFTVILLVIPRSLSDESDERRKLKKKIEIPKDILHEEYWSPNSRGMLLYRQIFTPKSTKIKAVLGVCHAFADHTSSFPTELAIIMCKKGYATIMLDCEGHGFSDGLHAYIPNLDNVTQDIFTFFDEQMATSRFQNIPLFLYGESMGGAVAFQICLLDVSKSLVKGAILMAPMLKIAEELKPPKFLQNLLLTLVQYMPLAPITPIKNLDDLCFKRLDNKLKAINNPIGYHKWVRLGTSLSMLNATEMIASTMEHFSHSFLIMHGGDDKVTCPLISQEFYNRAISHDKTIKIYPGCWHALLFGELKPKADEIFADMIHWLDERIERRIDLVVSGERGKNSNGDVDVNRMLDLVLC